jgi:hypothetical protein
MIITATVNTRAQIADRFADEQPAAEKPVQPPPNKPVKAPPKEPPPLFMVNDNIVGYYYSPVSTNLKGLNDSLEP